MDECFVLLYCFVIVGSISTQLPSPYRKTGVLKEISNSTIQEFCKKQLLGKYNEYIF